MVRHLHTPRAWTIEDGDAIQIRMLSHIRMQTRTWLMCRSSSSHIVIPRPHACQHATSSTSSHAHNAPTTPCQRSVRGRPMRLPCPTLWTHIPRPINSAHHQFRPHSATSMDIHHYTITTAPQWTGRDHLLTKRCTRCVGDGVRIAQVPTASPGSARSRHRGSRVWCEAVDREFVGRAREGLERMCRVAMRVTDGRCCRTTVRFICI